MNRIPLAGDVIERAIPYAGTDRVVSALSRDPALRSLPTDALALRLGTSRPHVENAIGAMVQQHTGVSLQVAGRSFDEAISDAGAARRATHTPEPSREAAGLNARMGAGQGLAEHSRMVRVRSRTGRVMARPMGLDARGYEPPPIPDLSALLLSDIFPTTRRAWSSGTEPTDDEKVILNWQHPLMTGAQSLQSKATISALSQGARSWDQDVTLPGGQHLSARNDGERKQYWAELQLLAQKKGWLNPPSIEAADKNVAGGWGHPMITLEYWDQSDGSHCRRKSATWDLQRLGSLGSSDAVISAVFGRVSQCTIENWDASRGGGPFGDGDLKCEFEGYDIEREALKNFAGLIGAVNSLGTAIATVAAVYCPACGVAIKVATQVATTIAQKQFGTTHALSAFGDLLLADAKDRALRGDKSAQSALRQFAQALIGQPAGSVNAVPAGGLVNDYLSTLGTAYGNVPKALYAYANATVPIGSAAELAQGAAIPLEDCQYAVAAMTDTLTRFADNMHEVYPSAPMSLAARLARGQLQANRSMGGSLTQDLGVGANKPPGSTSGNAPVLVAAGVGIAWAMGLLKGLL